MRLREGQNVELLEDVNCIPRGVYRFNGADEVCLHLRCGRKAYIAMTMDCLDKIRPLSPRSFKKRTNIVEFEERYYTLLELNKGKATDLSQPFTYCMMVETAVQ